MSEHQPAFKKFYARWHDLDVYVSEMVQCMEQMSDESKYLFALLLSALCDELLDRKANPEALNTLDWDKLMGLLKSKKGRRWYDDEPAMHRAFNLLYSLGAVEQTLVAKQLHVPARLVTRYETHCREHQQTADLDFICTLVETVFREGPEIAQQRYVHF